MNLHGEIEGNDDSEFNVLGVQTTGGSVIVPSFNEGYFLLLILNENGSLSTNVSNLVDSAKIRNELATANVTFKNCGKNDEATVVSSLLAQMAGEKLEIVNV